MFEDFLHKTVDSTTHKIRYIRDLINRIVAVDPELELRNLDNLSNRLENLNKTVELLPDTFREEEEAEEQILPDLTITDIIPTDYGHYWNFAITVKNIGESASGATNLDVGFITGNNAILAIPALDIEETATVNHQYSYDEHSIDTEIQTLVSTVNSTQIIEESNYSNNSKQIQLEVKPQQAPPAGKAFVIIHAHNPEGKEINGLTFPVFSNNLLAEFWIDGGFKTATASLDSQHGNAEASSGIAGIDAGPHLLEVKFNGITLSTNVTLEPDSVTELTFVFPRTEYEFDFDFSHGSSYSNTVVTVAGQQFYNDILEYASEPWDGDYGTSIALSVPAPLGPWFTHNHNVNYILTPTAHIYTTHQDHEEILGVHGNSTVTILTRIDSQAVNKNTISPISANSNFTTWLMQTNIIGEYVSMGVFNEDESQSEQLIPFPIPTGYQMYKDISPLYTYTKMDVRAFEPNSTIREAYTTAADIPANSISKSGIGEVELKLSSIPYDLEGTSF